MYSLKMSSKLIGKKQSCTCVAHDIVPLTSGIALHSSRHFEDYDCPLCNVLRPIFGDSIFFLECHLYCFTPLTNTILHS